MKYQTLRLFYHQFNMVKHTYITKKGTETKDISVLRAIRLKCLDCSGWVKDDVKNCHLKDCALWIYRFGKNDSRKGVGGKF